MCVFVYLHGGVGAHVHVHERMTHVNMCEHANAGVLKCMHIDAPVSM